MPSEVLTKEKVVSPFYERVEAVCKKGISSRLIINEYGKLGLNVERFFLGIDRVKIYECPLTKYRFYYPASIAGDDIFYEDLQELESGYYIEERDEYRIVLDKLTEGEKVLEVGCGDGYFLEKLRDRGLDGEGLEFNGKAVEKCRSKGLNVDRVPIDAFAAQNLEKFDVVVLFQVLEHIYDVSPFIQHLLTCLKRGGKLIFAVPDNSPYYKNFRIHLTFNLPPHHMGLWNAESLRNLEKVFDMSLVSTEYDDDYSSIPNYVYFLGDLLLTKFRSVYNNKLLRNLLIVLLIPYTLPVVLKLKFESKLRPHTIVATFQKH